MGTLAPWHWLILIVVVLLLFGYKKLPDAARSVGRSMRIFKSEVGSMREDSTSSRDESSPRPATKPPVIEGEPIVRPSASASEEPSRRTQE
jgi:sec-independent protein translocase protein TatA